MNPRATRVRDTPIARLEPSNKRTIRTVPHRMSAGSGAPPRIMNSHWVTEKWSTDTAAAKPWTASGMPTRDPFLNGRVRKTIRRLAARRMPRWVKLEKTPKKAVYR